MFVVFCHKKPPWDLVQLVRSCDRFAKHIVSIHSVRVLMGLCSSNCARCHNFKGRSYVDVNMLVRVEVLLFVSSLNLAFKV